MSYQRQLSLPENLKESIFLFGPRGTGKTSWLKQHFEGALYFDLLEDDTYTEFLARPTRLWELIPENHEGWIIIDEIQKIPALLNEVHRLIEHRGCIFILTGSSARTLRRQGVNLLAGRALVYHMHPMTAEELGDNYGFMTRLQNGNLPAVIDHSMPEKYLSSYVATYLKEEVLQEGLVRNLTLFSRFMEVASFSQGETLNYTQIAKDVGSNRHTITNFFDILEDLLIASRIPVFSKRAKREVISQPKFYFFDVGVYRSIRPKGPLDSPSEIDGPALETLFLQEAQAINDYYELGYTFYYWRTRTKLEVDFILYGERGLLAFELKRKDKLSSKDFKGLLKFREDYPVAETYILYGGEKEYVDNGVKVMSMSNVLKSLQAILS